jgi:light-regulated signal transduction histidine kinase (bacteriophytochrome)
MRRKCLVVYQYDPANRGEAGRYHTFPAAIVAVILQVLDSTLNNLHSAITESGAVITHDPRPTIFGDDAQLLQVFQKLIQNAIKFRSNVPPQIHISAAKTDTEWTFPLRITVSGSNPGFRSDFRDISAVTQKT